MRKFKKLLVVLIIVSMLTSTAAVFASADNVAYGSATVTASVLNIRESASTSSQIVGTVSCNSTVIILETTTSSWYKINYDGTVGYVYTAYLSNIVTGQNLTGTGVISANCVRLRQGSSTSSAILGEYDYGTVMTVLGIENGWYQVQYNGLAGYVRSDLMTLTSTSTDTPQSSDSTSSGSTGTIAYSAVRMRSGPSTSYSILGTYSYGTVMTITGSDSGWYQVEYNGTAGYVRSDLITLSGASGSSDIGDQIAAFAASFAGYSYVYGGASPSGFDCSGFVMYVYAHFGISISRTVESQWYNNGTSICKSELEPGDLIFLCEDGSGEPSHIGIYLGNGQFIHAANPSRGVVINDITSSYYSGVYYGAKSIVD